MASEDNEFVIQVMEGLDRRVDQLGRKSLTGPTRVVYLLWWTRAHVEDGGVALFHQGNWDVSDVANAFEQLDFRDAAKALRDSLSFFPAEVSVGENAERAGWLIHVYNDESEEDWEDVYDRVANFFQPFTDVILSLDPNGLFGTRVADYIRAHPEVLSDSAIYPAKHLANDPPPRPGYRWPNRRIGMS